MKKLLFLLPFLCLTTVGCNKEKAPTSKEYTLQVRNGGVNLSKYIDVEFGTKTLLEQKTDECSINLAKTLLALSVASFDGTIAIKGEDETLGQEMSGDDFLKSFGFKNMYKVNLGADTPIDSDDTIYMSISECSLNDTISAVNVNFKWTNSDAEWGSNFDIGADTDEYSYLYGDSHPEWSDKENHKGFDVAATRAFNAIKKYINRTTSLRNKTLKFFISGYSRGSDISNLLGAKLESKKYKLRNEYTSTAYCFAVSNTTTNENASEYKTIFNFANKNDLVANIPTPIVGLTRYGKTYDVAIAGTELENNWNQISGTTYGGNDITELLAAAEKVLKPREDIYKIPEEDDYKAVEYSQDEADLIDSRDYAVGLRDSLGIYKFVEISEIAQVTDVSSEYYGQYAFSITSRIALFMELAKKVCSSGGIDDINSILNYLLFFAAPIYEDLVFSALGLNFDGIAHAHEPLSYFVILDSLK